MFHSLKYLPYLMLLLIALAACKEDVISDDEALADFSMKYLWSNDSVAAFQFINLSYNADSYLWEFGDNTSSRDYNPQHLYFHDGWYRINLKAYNKSGTYELADTNFKLEFMKLPPTVDFDYVKFNTDSSVMVEFINKSTHIRSCNWSFGDGRGSSEINPVHHYYWSKDFRVRLMIHNGLWQSDSIVKYINISMK